MNDPGNGVTPPVTNGVGNAAPHHTTPHHTTKNTSSLNDALARGRENEASTTAAIREIHHLDAMTAVLLHLRPAWKPETVRAVLARDRRPWVDVVLASLRAATDPDVHHPAAIENHDARQYVATSLPPTVHELRTRPQCSHEAPSGLCALCRNGVE